MDRVDTIIPDEVHNFPLSSKSIVFIIGAFKGAVAQYYIDKHNPYIYLFEPQIELADDLRQRYSSNNKVEVLAFGLGECNYQGVMSQYGLDGASFVPMVGEVAGGERKLGEVREIGSFIRENGIDHIDLVHLNCEGYEWRLLPWIVEIDVIKKIDFLMVQFHERYEGVERIDEIVNMLTKTHFYIDNYYPKWVIWRRG